MKNKLLVIYILLIGCFCSGCTNQYIVGRKIQGDEYIGALRNTDFVHSDIQLHNLNKSQNCVGDIFLGNNKNLAKDNSGRKIAIGYSSLVCDDGTVLKLDWQAYSTVNWIGNGIDQFNNKYEFEVVTKKQFVAASGNPKQYSGESYKQLINNLIKY